MAVQVVEINSRSPESISIRADASGVFVVVICNDRPVDLKWLSRPTSGTLRTSDFLKEWTHDRSVPEPFNARSRPSLSIVIPTRERPDDLVKCLQSLSGGGDLVHEIIVVDNAPATNRTAEVAKRFGVRHVLEPVPGINNARNAGLANARHDIIAFIDDDAVASSTWMKAIVAPFADARIGCTTGLVLPLELETPAQIAFEHYCRHRRDLEPHLYSRERLAPSAAGIAGMGANMAFRRRLLLDLGTFDPRLGTGTSTRSGDETDMFARLLDAGWSIAYTPDAFVWHRHRRTERELRTCVFGYGVGLYSYLTKRVVEHGDLGAILTGVRWLGGPPVKAAWAKATGAPAPPWRVVLAETAGAPLGPFCLWYETWRQRARRVHPKARV